MNTGGKKGVLKSALKKTPKYNVDVEMDFNNPVNFGKSNTNRKYIRKLKESDNSIGLSNDSVNGHHTSVNTNLNAKRAELGEKSNQPLGELPGRKSKRLKSEYRLNGQSSIAKGLDMDKMNVKRDILTPKKNRASRAGKYKSIANDSYETRSFADSDVQSHNTMQTRRKRMSKSTVYSKQERQVVDMKNKSKMFKEGYNIHTQFPSLNERKQNTPKLDKGRRKKSIINNRRSQRGQDNHYIDEMQNPSKKRRPSQHYEVKTEGHLPAIESLEGKSEYDDYQIDDGLTSYKGGKSVKSYRPHPLKDPSFRKNLKFSSVRIANLSKFRTLYLINLREKMEESQKPAVPNDRFVRIMDTNKELSIPKFEHEEIEVEEDPDINIYSDSDQLEDEKEKMTPASSGRNTPENAMIKRLKTKVAKGLAMQGKISMMPGTKATSSLVKKKFEESKDFKIALEMMTDLHTVDKFRDIQKSEFLTRNPFEDSDTMTCEVEMYQTEAERKKMIEEIKTKHQKAYIKHCKKYHALPLPLLKKIRYEQFVLKNYQLSPAVARAFGMSMHYLKDTLNGVILCNNNMRDSEIVLILEGMKFNPITSLIIENNKLGPASLESLIKIVSYDDGKWYASIAPKAKESLNRITRLELVK